MPTPTPVPPVTSRVAAGYYEGWGSLPAVDALNANYRTLYLFAAHSTGGGAVGWTYAPPRGVQEARAQGRTVILSTGGAGSRIAFDNRAISTAFVDSIDTINTGWGGTRERPAFDGLDLNTHEATPVHEHGEYVWIGQELKRRFGAGFLITTPPAPWDGGDRELVRAMFAAGVLDYAAPQYYGGPGLAEPGYIVNSVRLWVNDVAGGDASKIVVGFGIHPGAADYTTTTGVKQAWDQIETEFPTIRGAFVWSIGGDQSNGWGFATQVLPAVLD